MLDVEDVRGAAVLEIPIIGEESVGGVVFAPADETFVYLLQHVDRVAILDHAGIKGGWIVRDGVAEDVGSAGAFALGEATLSASGEKQQYGNAEQRQRLMHGKEFIPSSCEW